MKLTIRLRGLGERPLYCVVCSQEHAPFHAYAEGFSWLSFERAYMNRKSGHPALAGKRFPGR
jgi:hypothetical protein